MEDHLEILDRPADRELATTQFLGAEPLLVRRVLLDQGIKLDRALDPIGIVVGRRSMSFSDRESLAAVAKASREKDYRLRDLVEAFVLSDLFQKR